MEPSPRQVKRSGLVSRVPFFYGWVIVAVSGVGFIMSGPTQTFTFSVFVDPMQNDLGWSRTLLSSIYTSASLLAGVTLIFTGRLLDRIGPRMMLTIIGVLLGLTCLWLGTIHHAAVMFAGFAMLRMLGQNSLTLVPTMLIGNWFVRYRGRAMALTMLGMAGSLALFPIMSHFIITRVGWRDAWSILGIAVLVVLVPLAALLLRNGPEELGLRPDGDRRPRQETGAPQPSRRPQDAVWTLREAVRTRAFWLVTLVGALYTFVQTALSFHSVSVFISKGIPAGQAATLFSVMAPSFLIGSFIAGAMNDRLPNRYTMIAGQVLVAGALGWTFFATELWHALAYGALLGMGGGFMSNVIAVIWPNFFGRQNLGSIRGLSTTFTVMGAALGPFPVGLLADVTGDYTVPLTAMLALPIVAVVLAVITVAPRKPISPVAGGGLSA